MSVRLVPNVECLHRAATTVLCGVLPTATPCDSGVGSTLCSPDQSGTDDRVYLDGMGVTGVDGVPHRDRHRSNRGRSLCGPSAGGGSGLAPGRPPHSGTHAGQDVSLGPMRVEHNGSGIDPDSLFRVRQTTSSPRPRSPNRLASQLRAQGVSIDREWVDTAAKQIPTLAILKTVIDYKHLSSEIQYAIYQSIVR